MKIDGNLITPEEGNKLSIRNFNKYFDELFLGRNNYYINDKIQKLNLSIDDIFEVRFIKIDDIEYAVELSNDYGKLVTNLIRLRYSLDDELAISSNIRLGDYSKEKDFQDWRQKCKNIAKEILDE